MRQATDNATFINTYLRMAHEPRVAPEHLTAAKLTTSTPYNLKWQVAVRKVFYDNAPFGRVKGKRHEKTI
jgi:hypothetical protein